MKKFLKLFLIFYIGSFLGTIIEELWCIIKNKTYKIRQSLIYEKVIPIYGLAATIILLIANRIGPNPSKIFIVGLVVASLVEYLFSYLQEKIFKTKAWDYKDFPLNFNGRVNLIYSIGFGLFSVFFVELFNKISSSLLSLFEYKSFQLIVFLIFVFFIIDCIISFMACYRQNLRRQSKEPKTSLGRFLDLKYSDQLLNKIYNNSEYIENNK